MKTRKSVINETSASNVLIDADLKSQSWCLLEISLIFVTYFKLQSSFVSLFKKIYKLYFNLLKIVYKLITVSLRFCRFPNI